MKGVFGRSDMKYQQKDFKKYLELWILGRKPVKLVKLVYFKLATVKCVGAV